jgi:hypothetical protein
MRLTGLFHLRVFGFHDQATHLTFHLGLRHTEAPGGSYRNPLAGGELAIYLARFFGVRGLLRYYFAATPTVTAGPDTGYRAEGGAFIDFSFFRIYADYFSEQFQVTSGVTGVIVGSRIYF